MTNLTRAITRALTSPLTRPITSPGVGGWTPAQWFLAGEQGIWLDPSDFTRYMGEKGPELVVNGDFSNGLTGWGAALGTSTLAVVSGQLEITCTGVGYGAAVATAVLIPAAKGTYLVKADATITTSLAFGDGVTYNKWGQPTAATLAAGGYTFYADGPVYITLLTNSNVAGTKRYFDNISVRELTAINTATMFQDSAGTTPVTAVEQPVGLGLDKRLGLVRGVESVVNGDFSAGSTGWTNPDTGPSVTTFSGGSVTMTAAAGSSTARLRQALSLPAGTYELTLDVTGYTGTPGAILALGNANSGDMTYASVGLTGVGQFRSIVTITGPTLGLAFTAANAIGGTITLDNVSIKSLAGNHASQATSAARPVLKQAGAYYYLNSDGVDDSAATAAGGGATTSAVIVMGFRTSAIGAAQTLFSDCSGNTGLKLEVTAGGNIAFSGGNGASINTATGAAVAANTDYVVTAKYDGTNLSVQLNRGTAATTACALSAGTAAITLGKDNGAATGFHNGRRYGTVYVKNTAKSAGEIASAEAYMAAKMGVTL